MFHIKPPYRTQRFKSITTNYNISYKKLFLNTILEKTPEKNIAAAQAEIFIFLLDIHIIICYLYYTKHSTTDVAMTSVATIAVVTIAV